MLPKCCHNLSGAPPIWPIRSYHHSNAKSTYSNTFIEDLRGWRVAMLLFSTISLKWCYMCSLVSFCDENTLVEEKILQKQKIIAFSYVFTLILGVLRLLKITSWLKNKEVPNSRLEARHIYLSDGITYATSWEPPKNPRSMCGHQAHPKTTHFCLIFSKIFKKFEKYVLLKWAAFCTWCPQILNFYKIRRFWPERALECQEGVPGNLFQLWEDFSISSKLEFTKIHLWGS